MGWTEEGKGGKIGTGTTNKVTIKRCVCISAMDYYLVIRKKKSCHVTWMDLEGFMLSGVSQI